MMRNQGRQVQRFCFFKVGRIEWGAELVQVEGGEREMQPVKVLCLSQSFKLLWEPYTVVLC